MKIVVSILLLLLALSSVTLVLGQSVPSNTDRERGRVMLNALKEDLKKHYYDTNFHGMDVDARFKAADEKIKVANSQGQIFGIIAQALVDLDDSHTFFIPPGRSYTTEYGWQMQMIGDKCYVVAVKPGSDADSKGLKEGDEIFSIDGFGPSRKNIWKIQYNYHSLRPQPGMKLVVIKPDGRELELQVMAKVNQGKQVIDATGADDGNDFFDAIREAENESRLNRHRYYEMGEELLIWRMPAFDLDEAKVDEMMSKAKKRKALILDLRGNGGGYEMTMQRMISNLFDRDVKIGDVKRRKETKPLEAKMRGDKPFAGKLIVLIDSRSGSASEVFSRVMQLEKRGTVIGDVSSGAVMRSRRHDHKVGVDTVVLYGASVTDADVIMSDGKSLERVGVTPDVLKVPTAADLAGKLDPVLSYAASLVGVPLTPEAAGGLFPVEWRKDQ